MVRGPMGESTTHWLKHVNQVSVRKRNEKNQSNSSDAAYITVTDTTNSNTVIKTCFWYAPVEHRALHDLP